MIDEFKSGHWYRWIGPKYKGDVYGVKWNPEGNMDFVLDGKPHKVNYGCDQHASFFDSPDPDRNWFWGEGKEYFEEVPERVLKSGRLLVGEWKDSVIVKEKHRGRWSRILKSI